MKTIFCYYCDEGYCTRKQVLDDSCADVERCLFANVAEAIVAEKCVPYHSSASHPSFLARSFLTFWLIVLDWLGMCWRESMSSELFLFVIELVIAVNEIRRIIMSRGELSVHFVASYMRVTPNLFLVMPLSP